MSAPSAPLIFVRPDAKNQSLEFFWNPPASDGGSPVTSYTLTDGSIAETIAASEGYTRLAGLTNGQSYSFTLAASNANGLGASAAFRTVQPGNPPDAPTSLSTTDAGSSTYNISWTNATNTGGASLLGTVLTAIPLDSNDNLDFANSNAFIKQSVGITLETAKLPLTSPYGYRVLVQNVNDPGYSPPIAYTSTIYGPGAVIPLAGSLFFNGSVNTYLKLSPGIAFGSGAYTIECWFYNNASWDVVNTPALLGGGPDGVVGSMSLFFSNSTSITTDSYGGLGQRTYTFPTPITLNAWHHFVLVRNASLVETVFIDGVKATGASGGTGGSGGQQTNSLTYSGLSQNVGIYYQGRWTGYLTNMRIVVGTAVYNPTASSITVPNTGPLGIVDGSNTQYLMLGATITTDSSSTQTVTNNSNNVTRTSSVKPF